MPEWAQERAVGLQGFSVVVCTPQLSEEGLPTPVSPGKVHGVSGGTPTVLRREDVVCSCLVLQRHPLHPALQKSWGLCKSRWCLQLSAASRADEAAEELASSPGLAGRALHPTPFHCAALTAWTFYSVLTYLPFPPSSFHPDECWQETFSFCFLSFLIWLRD